MAIPRRRLGKTGAEVSTFGLGGEGILRSFGNDEAASRLINRALDLGVNYLETARAYSGSEEYYGNTLKERRKDIFLASKSHARDKKGALIHLETSLKNLKTDYLDLWQVHDMRTEEEVEEVFGPGGAIEAFIEAKKKGAARFIGVTGHQEPSVIKKCIELFDFDTVLIPINPAEQVYKPFADEIIPIAEAKDMGVIAMKVYLRGLLEAPKKLLFSYALSYPVSLAVIGCDTIEQLEENAEVAANFLRLKAKEVQRLHAFFAPFARDLLYYKP